MAKILVVDDSASMRQLVSFTLKSEGHEIILAEDGAIALKLAKTSQVDLVISDINMPNMNGITLVKELRTLPNYKSVPILLLTTESSQDYKMEGKKAGATGWLVKPFSPDQLLATIKKVL